MARLSFRCDVSLVERVDEVRGGVPRERWLRAAVEQALGSAEAGSAAPGLSGSGRNEQSPAPAEQPRGPLVDEIVERYPETVGRESIVPLRARHGYVGPKRSVEPIPKGGKS